MNISVVLPCAADDGIERCIASIDAPVEVIAVLNRPTSRTQAIVDRLHLRQVSIPERNLGWACDAGVAAASHDLVLLMNSDCWFAPGTIERMFDSWTPGSVVSAPVRYDGTSWRTRVVGALQTLQAEEPPQAYQPGLLFDRRIRDQVLGYWFDHDIHWTEDADFHRRVVAGGLDIRLTTGTVWHRQPTICRHLRSAFRYGIGRRIAEEKSLFGTNPAFRWTPRLVADEFTDRRQRGGLLLGGYAALWITVFASGVMWQRVHDVYGTRDRVKIPPSGERM